MVDGRVGRGQLYAQQKIRTRPRINRLVKAVTAQSQLEAEVGRPAITESRGEQGVIVQVILCIVDRIGQRKEVIRPFQLLAKGNRRTEVLQRVTVTEGIGVRTEVIPTRAEDAAVETYRKRVSFLSSQPGLGKGEVIGLVGLTVGLDTQTE